MAKFLSLDIGNIWTGVAETDPLNILVKPLTTIKTDELNNFITKKEKDENIKKVILGYPKTMNGYESEQTKFTIKIKNDLEKKFPQIEFILWDERLTSFMANKLPKKESFKLNKIYNHARAAAFILDSYLNYFKKIDNI